MINKFKFKNQKNSKFKNQHLFNAKFNSHNNSSTNNLNARNKAEKKDTQQFYIDMSVQIEYGVE